MKRNNVSYAAILLMHKYKIDADYVCSLTNSEILELYHKKIIKKVAKDLNKSN